jgi:alpha-1,6-mannosyltransferase
VSEATAYRVRSVLLALLATGIAALGYLTPRTNTVQLLALAFSCTALAWWIYRHTKEEDVPQLLGAAFVLRLLLLFMLPNLSDDFYRFVWDGRLLAAGEAPFAQLPRDVLHTAAGKAAGLTDELYGQLNSPEYFTIYPPVAQATFWLAAKLWPQSVYGSVLVLRVLQLLAEAGTLWLLPRVLLRANVPARNALLYALNPLVILELTGNLHAEALVVFFCVAAIYFLSHRFYLSAVLFGLGIAAKLLPLLLLPLLWRLFGTRRTLVYALVACGVATLCFVPLLAGGFVPHLLSSIDLYFRKFEFNASLYYLVREAGFAVKGYNIIAVAGPALLLLSVAGTGLVALRKFQGDVVTGFARRAALALLIYYACAAIVHPWYVVPVLFWCVMGRWWFGVVWSVLVWVSYSAYGVDGVDESLWVVFLEYVLVFGVLGRELYVARFGRR